MTSSTPGLSVVVRRCESADVASIAKHEPAGRNYATMTYRRQTQGLCEYLVAWAAGEPIGSGELEWSDPPELKNLAVLVDWRRQGVGSRLLDAAEQLARPHHRITLGVATDNPDAARLYLARGYLPTGAHQVFTYSYVDARGVTRVATEEDAYLEKAL